MKKNLLFLTFFLLVFQSVKAEEKLDFALIAQTEQNEMREYVYQHYTPFIQQYVDVFVAQVNCNYPFIEEKHFNDLADNTIKTLISHINIRLKSSKIEEIRNSEPLRTYIANYIGVGLIDAQATVFTQANSLDYSTPEQCKEHESKIRDAYQRLNQKYVSLKTQEN